MKLDFVNQTATLPFEKLGELQIQLNEAVKVDELRGLAIGIAETLNLPIDAPTLPENPDEFNG